MTGCVPSFLGSPYNTLVSSFFGGQYVRNRLCEVEDNDVIEDEIEDPSLSPHQSETASLRDQPPSPPPVRRPQGPPGPNGSLHSFS